MRVSANRPDSFAPLSALFFASESFFYYNSGHKHSLREVDEMAAKTLCLRAAKAAK